MAIFWNPPKMRNNSVNIDEHRHVTWLELFYDLAFVVAIASIAHELTSQYTLKGFITFVALFIPVWWAWLGDTFYTNRFDPDDHGHQVFTLVQMIGIVGLAVFAHNGLYEGFIGFALSYILVRSIVGILNWRTRKENPEANKLAIYTSAGIFISLIFWLAAIFVPPPLRFWLVGIGIAVDLIAPMLFAKEQRRVHVNPEHLSARFGFFYIIMLGEVVVAVVRSVNGAGISGQTIFHSILAIVLGFTLWWVYFENDNGPKIIKNFFTPEHLLKKRNVIAGYVWVYAHLPLSMGIMGVAVGLEKLITLGPNISLTPQNITFLTVSFVLSLLSIGVMQLMALTHEGNQRLEHIKMLLPFISIIIILIATNTSPIYSTQKILVWLVAIGLLQVVLQEVLEHQFFRK